MKRFALLFLLLASGLNTPGPVDDPWAAELARLTPEVPVDYFNLAEEVADAAESNDELELARHLFRLAGSLDRDQLGGSACLALADLASDAADKSRFLALAELLAQGRSEPLWAPLASRDEVHQTAALVVSEAFSKYRQGKGRRALEMLDNPAATSLFEQYAARVGGSARFRTNARAREYNEGDSPIRSARELTRMLELEAAILGGESRLWSDELLLSGSRTFVEVDPDRLNEALRVNPEMAYYRNGRWVATP